MSKRKQILRDTGEFDQPLNVVSAVSILTYPAEQPKVSEMPTPAIGSFIRLKPSAQGAVELTLDEFDLLARLAVNDKLRSFHIVFEKPYRAHALFAGLASVAEK
ncbi:hypothetical protein [Herbaspirillum sp. ST 5-3]|uniref:hypothetical protein n=1 Tax=Oxalobacteraceae TaxID=75682 RepID=UPI0010A34C06|nr:hypothetical protein [Herbaspirillum sp. ST 5-3]